MAKHDFRDPERIGVMGVESRGRPGLVRRHAGQVAGLTKARIETGDPRRNPVGKPRDAGHAPQRGLEQPILEHVGRVLVVSHFQGERLPGTGGDLVGHPQAAPDQRQCGVDGRIAPDRSASQRALRVPDQRLGQCRPEIVLSSAGCVLGKEIWVLGVPEQEQQPRDAHLRLHLDVQVADANRAHLAGAAQPPPSTRLGCDLDESGCRKRGSGAVIDGADHGLLLEFAQHHGFGHVEGRSSAASGRTATPAVRLMVSSPNRS